MYRITHGTNSGLPDVDAFLDLMNRLDRDDSAAVRDLFTDPSPITVARAPGRLDVMGGIADYSGSLVLQLPIREATFAAGQRRSDRQLRIVTRSDDTADRTSVFETSLAEFEQQGQPVSYDDARARFQLDPATQWAAYAAGAFLVLMRERDVRFEEGVSLLISSQVPEGKGVSSSAALEVAVMQAVAAAFDIAIEPRELAILCQLVENRVVGAPCGVMDQMTASCGQAGQLLTLLCQPAELLEPIAIPDELELWGIDSGIRHAVSGSDYGSVRVGAFMGYRMIAEQAGLAVQSTGAPGEPIWIDDPTWDGYLANVSPSHFEQRFAHHLPERILGRDFIERFGGTTDLVTRVDPDREYAVRTPTAHPIHEHFRVRTFARLLTANANSTRTGDEAVAATRLLLGELMYQSHASYSACGLGSEGTDRLVELVRDAGPDRGFYGAKITGGGSGGTVAFLARRGCGDVVRQLADRYAAETGRQPYVFSASSPGAAVFGHLILEKS